MEKGEEADTASPPLLFYLTSVTRPVETLPPAAKRTKYAPTDTAWPLASVPLHMLIQCPGVHLPVASVFTSCPASLQTRSDTSGSTGRLSAACAVFRARSFRVRYT